jgi:uncharacterized protein YbaP (TraB family)
MRDAGLAANRARTKVAAAVFVLATSFAIPQPAPAQDAPPSPAALVEEVEVIARLPGPALWRVSTPTSQLWILGMARSLPKDFQWDDRRLVAALDGARELVLPPVATAGLGDAFSIVVDPDHVRHLPSGKTMRGDLPPALATRWEAAARSIDRDPAHYDHWRPVPAALMLASDGNNHYGLVGNPMARLLALAKDRRVKLRQLAAYKATDLLHSLMAPSDEAAQACVALAADIVEHLPVDGPRRATAWATGDLKTLKMVGDGLGTCRDAAPASAAFRARAAADWAMELGHALAAPGKTVVAVDLDDLIGKGGLLDQLKAQGLEVIGPAY